MTLVIYLNHESHSNHLFLCHPQCQEEYETCMNILQISINGIVSIAEQHTFGFPYGLKFTRPVQLSRLSRGIIKLNIRFGIT